MPRVFSLRGVGIVLMVTKESTMKVILVIKDRQQPGSSQQLLTHGLPQEELYTDN